MGILTRGAKSGGRSLLAAAVLVIGCSDKAALEPEAALPASVIALSDQFSSDFALVDENGATVADEDLKNKVSLIYFGFATCPDVCPMALGRISAALDLMSEEDRAKVNALFITVDPERDTPERLAAYLAFDKRLRGLTGSAEAIKAAKASFKVYAEPEPTGDPKTVYVMNHTSLIYLVDSTLKPRYAIQDAATPQEIVELVRRFL
jgi:protein SCO1/2